jgi:hypothetical protein
MAGRLAGKVDLVFYLTRAAWPHLKTSSGVVVNMDSLNGSLSFIDLVVDGGMKVW